MSCNSIFKASAIFSASFNPRTAPSSSSLGMLVDFKGATLGLDMMGGGGGGGAGGGVFTVILQHPSRYFLHDLSLGRPSIPLLNSIA